MNVIFIISDIFFYTTEEGIYNLMNEDSNTHPSTTTWCAAYSLYLVQFPWPQELWGSVKLSGQI